jgi:hypothetical protein
MPKLLLAAMVALAKLLKHPDVSVRQRAVELIVEHTQILEKLAARPLDHPARSSAVAQGNGSPDVVITTDEQRELSQADAVDSECAGAARHAVPDRLEDRRPQRPQPELGMTLNKEEYHDDGI